MFAGERGLIRVGLRFAAASRLIASTSDRFSQSEPCDHRLLSVPAARTASDINSDILDELEMTDHDARQAPSAYRPEPKSLETSVRRETAPPTVPLTF